MIPRTKETTMVESNSDTKLKPNSTDKILLEQLKAGQKKALDQIISRWSPMVYGTCYRLTRKATVAEDITQAVFLLLLQKCKEFDSTTILSSWLYRAAIHKVKAEKRSSIRRVQRERSAIEFNSQNAESTEEETSKLFARIRPDLEVALAELPENIRHVLILRYFAGKKPMEISRELNIGQSTVSMRLSRGVDKLRTILQKRGMVLSSAAILSCIENGPVIDPSFHSFSITENIAEQIQAQNSNGFSEAVSSAGVLSTGFAAIVISAAVATGISITSIESNPEKINAAPQASAGNTLPNGIFYLWDFTENPLLNPSSGIVFDTPNWDWTPENSDGAGGTIWCNGSGTLAFPNLNLPKTPVAIEIKVDYLNRDTFPLLDVQGIFKEEKGGKQKNTPAPKQNDAPKLLMEFKIACYTVVFFEGHQFKFINSHLAYSGHLGKRTLEGFKLISLAHRLDKIQIREINSMERKAIAQHLGDVHNPESFPVELNFNTATNHFNVFRVQRPKLNWSFVSPELLPLIAQKYNKDFKGGLYFEDTNLIYFTPKIEKLPIIMEIDCAPYLKGTKPEMYALWGTIQNENGVKGFKQDRSANEAGICLIVPFDGKYKNPYDFKRLRLYWGKNLLGAVSDMAITKIAPTPAPKLNAVPAIALGNCIIDKINIRYVSQKEMDDDLQKYRKKYSGRKAKKIIY